jgi:hypothetical protein
MLTRCLFLKLVRKVTTLAMIAFVGTTVALGQASVPESKETLSLYVNASQGSDSNPGTQLKPFKTLTVGVKTALAQSNKGIGTKLTVLPGTYRESITLGGSSSDTPVTVEAATAGTVTVSGADVWTGWLVDSANPKIFTHAWPYKWGLCSQLAGPTEQDIVRRQEMIFVNGFKLTQVLSLGEMMVGTFFVDESNQTVYVWPASGTNMTAATIEVSTRPALLLLQGLHDWVVRGINFQYASGCRQTQAAVTVTTESSNVLFDEDNFLWNNSIGLNTNGITYVTVQNSHANHNGDTGFQAQEVKYGLWSSDEGSYNNWRGAQGAYYAWDSAGGKFMEMHDDTFESFSAFFNQSKGIHFDTDNINITANSLVSSENLRSGLQIEATEGPVTVSYSHICNSNLQVQANQRFDGGINLVDASHVILSNDVLYNNGTAQILVDGQTGGIPVKNWETGTTTQVFNQNLSVSSSTIEAKGSQKSFQDGYLPKDWAKFVSSLASNYNTWWNASNSSVFTVPVPVGYTSLKLSAWTALTGQDSHSVFATPSVDPSTSCEATPDAADYWFVADSNTYTVSPGAKSSVTLTAIPFEFTGTISLNADVSQIPGGTAAWSQKSIDASGSSVLTVATASSARAGTYPLTMIANSGNITRTVTVFLVVQ